MNNKIKKYNKKIIVYELKYDFIVEVIKDNKSGFTEFWLHNKDYGIKMFMYCIECKENEIEEYITSDIDSYISIYRRGYIN